MEQQAQVLKDVHLKDLIVAFSHSVDDAFEELMKSNNNVKVDDLEFSFTVNTEISDDAILRDLENQVKGLRFEKVSELLPPSNGNHNRNDNLLNIKLTFSNYK